MSTIVVGGALANKLWNGGAAWTRLSWILGFRRLGFDVLFVEEILGAQCVDASGDGSTVEHSANLAYFAEIMARFGLTNAAALVADGGAEIYGSRETTFSTASLPPILLFKHLGHLRGLRSCASGARPSSISTRLRSLWHTSGLQGRSLEGHDLYFTVGKRWDESAAHTAEASRAPVRHPSCWTKARVRRGEIRADSRPSRAGAVRTDA